MKRIYKRIIGYALIFLLGFSVVSGVIIGVGGTFLQAFLITLGVFAVLVALQLIYLVVEVIIWLLNS